jgi:hypothetical protein
MVRSTFDCEFPAWEIQVFRGTVVTFSAEKILASESSTSPFFKGRSDWLLILS